MTHDITQADLDVIRGAIARARGDAAVTWGLLPTVHLDSLKTASGSPYICLHVDANPERGAVIVKTAIEGTEVMPPFAWLYWSAPMATAFETIGELAEFLAAKIVADELNVITSEVAAVCALQQGLAKHGLKLTHAGDKRFDVKTQGNDAVLASLEPQPLSGVWLVRSPGNEEVIAQSITEYVGDLVMSLH
jgi:hypothetical protein